MDASGFEWPPAVDPSAFARTRPIDPRSCAIDTSEKPRGGSIAEDPLAAFAADLERDLFVSPVVSSRKPHGEGVEDALSLFAAETSIDRHPGGAVHASPRASVTGDLDEAEIFAPETPSRSDVASPPPARRREAVPIFTSRGVERIQEPRSPRSMFRSGVLAVGCVVLIGSFATWAARTASRTGDLPAVAATRFQPSLPEVTPPPIEQVPMEPPPSVIAPPALDPVPPRRPTRVPRAFNGTANLDAPVSAARPAAVEEARLALPVELSAAPVSTSIGAVPLLQAVPLFAGALRDSPPQLLPSVGDARLVDDEE